MVSNQKLAIDLVISILTTLILSTTILSISTNNWNIKHENLVTNRTGLFQFCSNSFCCDTKELDRAVTLLVLFTIIFLIMSTFSSYLLMAITTDYSNKCYIIVPLTLFGAGISMTLTLIQLLDQIYLNGSSAFMFIVDTIFAYILGIISLLHANRSYF